ncbi:hypothetical protein [Serratia sp. Se-RSBMAAmG]|uniref:hypothetical protein n=1 Tax=Serratia sp. Se-RSBMAAmG TaxID=3043305 RepID=UPI0024AFC0A7|nr:hypothetical protein [Serratia sp. Se-RSBMAAmG]MDI6976066.1 hypothetical protein [Serratia sp. Se-RSBMAAmG]
MDQREKIEAITIARLERCLKAMIEKDTIEYQGFLGISVDFETKEGYPVISFTDDGEGFERDGCWLSQQVSPETRQKMMDFAEQTEYVEVEGGERVCYSSFYVVFEQGKFSYAQAFA